MHPRTRSTLITAAVLLGLVACSSEESASSSTRAPEPSIGTTAAPFSTSPALSTTTTEATTTSTIAPPTEIVCDADSGEIQTFDVPLGTEVVLVAISTTEREYHLHEYDIELTGTEVRFTFTATIPGEIELTEHPGHSTVCTLTS
ncbi:MAG: hypothetical protein EBS22_00445 [Acidimicrobiia bacterium]|nr:hypothetical protein [Acidimicrobiia bacterium]